MGFLDYPGSFESADGQFLILNSVDEAVRLPKKGIS